MLELIRVKIIKRRASSRQDMGKWFGEIRPRIAEILEIAVKNSGSLTSHLGGNGNFQINDNDDTTPVAVVDLTAKTCNCNRWNLTRIICMHAISAIYWRHEDPLSYVHDHCKKSNQKKIWQNVIYRIKMERYWNKSELPPLLPLKIVKQAGRPKKLRCRVVSEIPANARKFTRIHRIGVREGVEAVGSGIGGGIGELEGVGAAGSGTGGSGSRRLRELQDQELEDWGAGGCGSCRIRNWRIGEREGVGAAGSGTGGG
ncbi:hypothetical protein LWI29_030102 [Acer saccharum]|uniref:SWIM-type domain-containing protein n=1 Tax=Acer saccharum TaxID=4024 RepID=A0AA39W909_ACESA|nr:hypothetical protein LWI29_030102 [Acer saccharum]